MRGEDRVRLRHKVEAAEELAGFLQGHSQADFEGNRLLLFAVIRSIEVFGEAASRISPEARAANPQLPWSDMVAMRNRLIHGYFDIDARIVWKTATEEIPALLPLIRSLCEA
ncbi:MAG: DUF86 domain-containing protein [Thermoanaerobaculia bacterium]|nr:DUF86 domain-containing protein [Thermoanaerobaculia bacterium]